MKIIILLALIFIIATTCHAQYSRHIVQLTDKDNNSFSLDKPSSFLSQRAIVRRTKYNISIDSLDLPVTQMYIDSISRIPGVRVLSTSKWLNELLIQTTDINALNSVSASPFVKKVKAIAPRTAGHGNRFKEEIKPLTNTTPHKANGTSGNTLNYGSNYAQVHIHEGEYLHNKGFTGEAMQITVLDAGFSQYKTITAFDSLRMNHQVLGERDFVDFDNSVDEDDTHGMYCLSIMAANWPGSMVGTAPMANYWLIRTENAQSEYPVEEHNWVVGAEFADSTGSDLISSSLGYYDFDDPAFNHTYQQIYKNATPVSQGAAIAVRKGMIVMNSAGNAGGSWWNYITFPADVDSVCSVGAINYSGQIAGFSSVGFPGKIKPDVVSVGVSTVIAGFNNMPVSGNGTSFSNPNLAGLVACLWQAFPQLNNMKILNAVYRSSDRYSHPDSLYGFGVPNFRLAYEMLQREAIGVSFIDEWLVPVPNPFGSNLAVYLQAPETGKVQLRLVDAAGRTVRIISTDVSIDQIRKFEFSNTANLSAGVYFLQYISSTQKQVKKLVKL